MSAEDVIHRIEEHVEVVDHASAHIQKIADKADHATAHLERMGHAGHDAAEHIAAGAHHAHGVLDMLDHTIGGLIGTAAVFGAAFSLHEALESTEKYLKNIKEVHDLTGATAGETDFMLSSARRAGVPYENMAHIMGVLSKRGAAFETQMANMTGLHVPSMLRQMQSLGVNINKGPVTALEQMSVQVKKGHLGSAQLMQSFRIPQRDATNFETFLRNLDKAKLKQARKGGGGFISSDDLEGFKDLEEAQNRIADTWNRIKVVVLAKLMPVAARLAEKFADRLESFLPKLQTAAQFVSDHFDAILMAAKALVAVLTARKFLGVMENLTSPGGFIGKLAAGGFTKLLAAGGGGGISTLVGTISRVVGVFIRAVPQLALLAAAAWAVYQAYSAIQANVDGVKDRIINLWDSISARFELIGDKLGGIWEKVERIFGGSGSFSRFIGKLASGLFENALRSIDTIFLVLQVGLGMLVDRVNETIEALKHGHLPDMSFKHFADSFEKNYKAAQADTAALMSKNRAEKALEQRRKDMEQKPPNTIMNFPNAKFDIHQQFAEGFDPDRVAVSLTQALADAGEMKVQSPGFSGLYAFR